MSKRKTIKLKTDIPEKNSSEVVVEQVSSDIDVLLNVYIKPSTLSQLKKVLVWFPEEINRAVLYSQLGEVELLKFIQILENKYNENNSRTVCEE